MGEAALGSTLTTVSVTQQRALAAVFAPAIAVTVACGALQLASTLAAHARGVRRLDEEAAASRTRAAMICITRELDLTAAPVTIAVGVAFIADVKLTATRDTTHAAMLG